MKVQSPDFLKPISSFLCTTVPRVALMVVLGSLLIDSLTGIELVGTAEAKPDLFRDLAKGDLEGSSSKKGGSHGGSPEGCPPETRGMKSNCKDYWEAINKEALRQGYEAQGNTAKFLVTYVKNKHDCTEIAAEVACVAARSDCIEQKAEQLWNRPKFHSNNWVPGIGECDYTALQTREGGHVQNKGYNFSRLADHPATVKGSAHPDPGADVDPAYNCAMNGANKAPLGGGGFGAGGPMDNMLMMAIMQLLQGNKGQTPDSNAPVISPSANSSPMTIATPSPLTAPTQDANSEASATSPLSGVGNNSDATSIAPSMVDPVSNGVAAGSATRAVDSGLFGGDANDFSFQEGGVMVKDNSPKSMPAWGESRPPLVE